MQKYAIIGFCIIASIAVVIHLILRIVQEQRTKKMIEKGQCLTDVNSKEMLEESKKHMKLSFEHTKRSMEHMTKVEDTLERIALALEKKDKKS